MVAFVIVWVVRAVPEIILTGGGRQFFWLLHPQDMRKGTNAHPQDKSENQLPPPHLNILVPRDKLDIIMHRPSRQKNHCHPPPRIISRTALMFVSVTYCSHDYIHVISWLSEWLIDWFCIIIWQVNPAMVEQLQRNGMLFVGHDDEGKRMEIMELQGTYSSLICFFFVWFFCCQDWSDRQICVCTNRKLL